MSPLLAFIVGMFIGAPVGVVVMALMFGVHMSLEDMDCCDTRPKR